MSHANPPPLFASTIPWVQTRRLAATVYWKPPKQARVNASDSYRSRSLQKAGNNTVVLLQNVMNGDYNSTHQVNIFYPDGAAMDQSAQTTASSPAWKEFQSALRKAARPEWENTYAILRAKVKPGDISSATPTSIIFAITVTDGPRFMQAFDDFWGSPVIQQFPGAVYLGAEKATGIAEIGSENTVCAIPFSKG
jgi:hypothetical protein